MTLWNALIGRGEREPQASVSHASRWLGARRARPDLTRLLLLVSLGTLSWVATYVGMLELIEANLGGLSAVQRVIVGFSCAMLMTMIVWLLDKMFAPAAFPIRLCYIAGYLFLSLISVGFGFGFYWKILESRGAASRSAERAIEQVQGELFAAATRLEQLRGTLDELTAVSRQKAEVEHASGRTCPNSGPGDGPRRKMREDDAQRFAFAADFVKGRIATSKNDMAALDTELQKIVSDDPAIIDPKSGTRNEFLRAVGRKINLTVTGFNAFRSDSQLRQIASDLATRAEETQFSDGRGGRLSCPDPQLQAALRGVTGAIAQLPELTAEPIAVVEGPEATIEAFRRLTATLFAGLTLDVGPARGATGSDSPAAAAVHAGGNDALSAGQPALLAKRDYVPLGTAIFVDICLLLVSIGRPINSFLHLERDLRLAETGPVLPILARFHDIHDDDDAVKYFEVFRDVIFDANGQYYVAVPLRIPAGSEDEAERAREAHRLANLCYALEGKGILRRPRRAFSSAFVMQQLKLRGSKFARSFAGSRPPRFAHSWRIVRSLWAETPYGEDPAFAVYRFKKGAWPEMILQAVMRAARDRTRSGQHVVPEPLRVAPRNGRDPAPALTDGGRRRLAAVAPHYDGNGGDDA
jgi:hypothetical protein